MEPFYICQTAEPMDRDEREAWFKARMAEAKAEGAQHARFTVDGPRCLVEAWKERIVPDEGSPRWSLKKSET